METLRAALADLGGPPTADLGRTPSGSQDPSSDRRNGSGSKNKGISISPTPRRTAATAPPWSSSGSATTWPSGSSTTRSRSLEDIGLPLEHILPLTRYQNGLVLVTGSVGSGKSTTLAALVDFINRDREDHILTLEDPIEYVFESKGCHVNQREVHKHTESFARALRGALREDPDVIMVGEMRDLETIQLALTAAETGHLVLGTLHTGNAPRTLDRVLDVFPTDQRDQIRIMVSESLRGILSQQLVPRADGNGRVLALELLVNTPAVSNCIREGKTFMLPGVMQTGKNVGMITMDESLRQLYVKGLISSEETLFRSDDKNQMKAFFES